MASRALIVALVLLGNAVAVALAWWYVWFTLIMLPGVCCVFATWAALIGRAAPWRLVATCAALAACLVVADSAPAWNWDTTVTVMFLLIVPLSLALFVLRAFGLRLLLPIDTRRQPPVRQHARRLQFSLREFIEWTIGLGLVSGLFGWVLRQDAWQHTVWMASAGLAVILLLLLFATLWPALGSGHGSERFGCFLLGLIFTCSLELANPVTSLLFGGFPLFGFLHIFWPLLSFSVLRLGGYRLLWVRRSPTADS